MRDVADTSTCTSKTCIRRHCDGLSHRNMDNERWEEDCRPRTPVTQGPPIGDADADRLNALADHVTDLAEQHRRMTNHLRSELVKLCPVGIGDVVLLHRGIPPVEALVEHVTPVGTHNDLGRYYLTVRKRKRDGSWSVRSQDIGWGDWAVIE